MQNVFGAARFIYFAETTDQTNETNEKQNCFYAHTGVCTYICVITRRIGITVERGSFGILNHAFAHNLR
jgi:hypothetical protein